MIKSRLGFSLIELSIVILIIGILMVGVTQGSRIISEARLKSALSLTYGSPITATSGLVFWADTTEQNLKTSTVANIATTSYSTLGNGDLISAWNDRNTHSSNKITLTAPGDGNRPTYVQKGIGNLPSLRFIRSSSNTLRSTSAPLGNGDDTYTMIAVFRPITFTANGYVLSQSISSATTNRVGSIFLSSTTDGFGFGGFSNDLTVIPVTLNMDYIGVVRVNNDLANNITIFSNGEKTVGATPSPSALNMGAQFFSVGARTGNISPFDGLISEVIIYDRALTDIEIGVINNYLSAKYSIRLS